MATDQSSVRLEIGHVLFTDIVGYSKLLSNEQRELFDVLNEVVRNTQQFREAENAGKLVRIPTGDGIALVFFTSPDAPVRCAQEIGIKLRQYPKLPLRMGISSGPVDHVSDVNDRQNVTGAGINMAKRVMDCGDAGHILLSKRAADDLAQYAEWRPHLHELGEVEVKHGVRIGICNLCFDGIGNSALPEKLKSAARAKRRQRISLLAFGFLLLVGGIGGWLLFSRAASKRLELARLPEKSIAVLPFENLSAEKDDAFFADGIQDDVLTTLGKVKELTVIARTSVMSYRGTAVSGKVREIGKTLGVSHVLEGSVRRSAGQVVLNVRLIDTRDEHQVWSERYDRTLTESIGLQGELAAQVAQALRARLNPEETARLAVRPTNNPEAYVLYLKARDKEHAAPFGEGAIAVDELYGQAVVLDPKFAVAVARQSMWNSIMYQHMGRESERKIKAHALATEALRLAPDLPEAHLAQGIWYFRAGKDFDAALKEFSIAAQTISNDPELLANLGVLYRRQGRWREALAAFRRATEVDPRAAEAYSNLAQTYCMLREWKAAAAEYRHALEIQPNDVRRQVQLASIAMFGEGDLAAAKTILHKLPTPGPGANRPPDETKGLQWELCMLERDFAGAQKLLDDFPAEEFPPPFVGVKSLVLGLTVLARGDTAAGRRLLEKARPIWEAKAHSYPDDPTLKALLAVMYAYLERKDDALRESHRGVELCPESKDALEGPAYLSNLAWVCALTGETEEAVNLLEHLLTTPVANLGDLSLPGVTLADLRLSWRWDALRSNVRFQKILAAPEPKTIY